MRGEVLITRCVKGSRDKEEWTDLGCLESDPVARLTVAAEQERRINDDFLVSDLNGWVDDGSVY